ncbi:TonB-dependent receptor [Sphingobacterium thalpophilum]|uniref:TonB-dependent receptor n=1 Tax=Sphingobacterium thalpophilum TaxID=259 RepID=A0ABV4HIL9_9SPHI
MKSLKGYLLCAVAIMVSEWAAAQQYNVKGRVYDLLTQVPLQGVSIKISPQETVTSDHLGYFQFSTDRTAGTLSIAMLGYKQQTVRYDAGGKELHIQLETDEVHLNEVRVGAFLSNKSIKETAGAIAVITDNQIRQGSGVSLQGALNSIPGVRMDQSTLSEARISIRGNGVRAQYGIRNVKIYVNDIPVTEADGTSRIEALDVNDLGKAEVIKGPASSIYGGGTGGVINFQLMRSPYQEQSLEVSAIAGSYGLRRLATAYRSGGDKMNSYVSYGWQQYKGYRDHSEDKRRFFTGNFQLFPSPKRTVTVLLNRTSQDSQIPGSLTQAQVDDNPKQANASNLDKQAARYQNWTRIGLGQQYLFNDRFSNSTSIFTYFYDLDHPLPYAYLRNYYQSYGGRTRFTYDAGIKLFPTTFTVGAEFNRALTKGVQYVNEHGTEGAISGNSDYKNGLYSLFYQSTTAIGKKTALTLGVSYTGISYKVKDYLISTRSGTKRFNPEASPRIALSHNFGHALSLHGSISAGFSPPSSSEIQNEDRSINTRIQAEKGTNYELNAKGSFFDSRLSYELDLFKMNMKGELIAQSIQQGITVYNNSGRTDHKGAELSIAYLPVRASDGHMVTLLRPYVALTYSDFKFVDYKILGPQNEVTAVYDGNDLTGIAPWVANAGLQMETRLGIYFFGSYYFNDRLPVNDANTVFNAAYQLLNAKIGWKKEFAKHFVVNVYGGMDNITNRNYSSLISLNASGWNGGPAPYFNPSPRRNGYGGFNLKYSF